MFDLSPEKVLVLGFLAVVVLGPNRLPSAARSAGRFFARLRTMSTTFQTEVRDALGDDAELLTSVVTELRPPQVRRSVQRAVTSAFATDGSFIPNRPGPGQGVEVSAESALDNAPDDPSFN